MELLIVMSVIGLLSALAMPVYQTAQARSQRQLAKLALMKSAQWLEQAATTQGSYPANLPASVWQTPELKYRISINSQSQTYVLTATPFGNQQADDCGSLTLNQAGQRGAQIALRRKPRHADGAVGFVHRADGGDARMGLGNTAAVSEPGLPGIAAFGVDSV